jgi:hypothetical protein
MSKQIPAILTLVLTFMGFGLYQNCTQVDLAPKIEEIVQFSKLDMAICLNGDLKGYTVGSFNILNANARSLKGQLQFDSDSDGLPDSLESHLGFNPKNRRSFGAVLDSLCYALKGQSQNCAELNQACENLEINEDVFGFTPCDYQIMNGTGLDTDKDNIPDSLELLSSLLLDEVDSLLDYDMDGMSNIKEATLGTDPNFNDTNLKQDFLLEYSINRMNSEDLCPDGERWILDSKEPLITHGPEISAEEIPNFKRSTNENYFLVWLVLKPTTQVGKLNKLFGTKLLLKEFDKLNLTIEQFEEVGEW